MARGYSGKIIDTQSAGGTVGALGPNEVGGAIGTNFTITFGPGTTAGVVVIESGDVGGYGGAYVQEASVAWAAASKKHRVYVPGGPEYLQARIATPISGGTVDVKASVIR